MINHVILSIVILCSLAIGSVYMPVQERGRVRAPEITGGRGWLNTDDDELVGILRFELLEIGNDVNTVDAAVGPKIE